MRFKINFSFDGKKFFGSQKQIGKRTIQGELERALSEFFDESITITMSGRTDAGVSAIKQIAHFDIDENSFYKIIGSTSKKDLRSFVIRLNYILNEDIKICDINFVNEDFHARFDAKVKTYFYNFYISEIEIPYLSRFCLWVKTKEIDVSKIKTALKYLIGQHDFSAFCASGSEVQDKIREIYEADIIYNELGFYSIKLKGNGFLYNMVRIIVGTMLEIGFGKREVSSIEKLFVNPSRADAGKTVSSVGLVLKDIETK